MSALTNAGPPYLFKGLDDDDSAWNLVRKHPIGRSVLSADKKEFLPEEVTARCADGAVRVFNPMTKY